jgi:DNA-binding NarL/FixJ family response regulator
MFDRLAQTASSVPWHHRAESADLTPRELEVVHLITGQQQGDCQKAFCIGLYTVNNHVHNIVEKLQVEDRHKAVEYARRR